MSQLTRFNQLTLNDQAQTERRFSASDLAQWCRLAAVDQPCTDIPEPLIAGLFSYLLGEKLPGHGTNYLKQRLTFHSVAGVDEPLTATVTINRLRDDKALVNLTTTCHGRHNRLICDGEALVRFQH